MKLTPKNIEWTIADNKIIKKLNDWSFAEGEAVDLPIDDTGWYFSSTDVEWALQEIWSVISSSWWPVDWLDWIVFRADNSTQYRANYRWDTLWSWSSWWKWVWYDNTNKTIIVSQDNVVKKYNTQWTEIWSVTTSWWGDILKWSNLTKVVFTRNWCQKINLNTFTLWWTVWGTLLDISPDWTVWCSITNNQFNTWWIESFTITSFDTNNLSIINTYTYQHLNWFWNNIFVWATLINNTDMVVYYWDWGNWSISYVLRKININTNATITSAWVWNVNDQWYAIQYSTSDNKIYYSRDINTWFASRPTLYSISTSLTSNTAVSNSLIVSQRLYRCSDWSMWYDRWDSWTTRYWQLFINVQNKFWNSIWWRDELVTPWNRSQLTPIY